MKVSRFLFNNFLIEIRLPIADDAQVACDIFLWIIFSDFFRMSTQLPFLSQFFDPELRLSSSYSSNAMDYTSDIPNKSNGKQLYQVQPWVGVTKASLVNFSVMGLHENTKWFV